MIRRPQVPPTRPAPLRGWLSLIAAGLLASCPPLVRSQETAAEGQEEEEQEEGVDTSTLPPDVAAVLRAQLDQALANSRKESPSPAQGATPEGDRRFQELGRLTFDRSPTNVIRELALRASGSRTNLGPAQQFQSDAVVGDWPAAGRFLATLPPAEAARLYRSLVDQMTRALRIPPSGPLPPDGGIAANVPQGSPATQRPAPAVAILPEEVIAIADAHPGPLDEETAQALGVLLRGTLRNPGLLEPVVAQLRRGTPRLGGSDPGSRAAAAALLIGAEALGEAGPFMPPEPPAGEPGEPRSLDLHARFLAAEAQQARIPGEATDLRRRAWGMNLRILRHPSGESPGREAALRRLMQLAPHTAQGADGAWIPRLLEGTPDQRMSLLATTANLTASGIALRDPVQRQRNLLFARQLVEGLLTPAGANTGATPRWEKPLEVLAILWLHEAELSSLRHRKARPRGAAYDAYGNAISPGVGDYDPEELQNRDPLTPPPIPHEGVIASAPTPAWLDRLTPLLGTRVRLSLVDLHIRNEEEAAALPLLRDVARVAPTAATRAARELLRSWGRTHNPNGNPNASEYQARLGYPQGMPAAGIPLTRAAQERNLRELATLARELKSSVPGAPDEKALVAAFAAAHSQAEVYRTEDLEAVFGPVRELSPATLGELLQSLRGRLAGQWRSPKTQQQAQTHRSDRELSAEVTRGYTLLSTLVDQGIAGAPADWRLHLARGAALFDWAEFDYGNKADLATYGAKRDAAFAALEQAAALYARVAPTLGASEETAAPYQQWLNATLGASDLAYLSRPAEPSPKQLDRITAALGALPQPSRDRHLGLLGRALSENLQSLKPELKPLYLDAALQVIGDHPSGEEARRVLTYYKDLLREIQLDLRVDGTPRVGHTEPFGVFVALRHTEAVARESGGFGRYLQAQPGQGFTPFGQPQPSYREDFERQARERLAPGFEVLSITFHDPKGGPRGYGRPGWSESPYAYLLLKARDAAIDRIPSLQLDMDFLDRHGQVVLPIASSPCPIDARPETGDPRPAGAVEIIEILDPRELASGRVTLEIKASAHGLLPPLDSLLSLDQPGLVRSPVPPTPPGIQRVEASPEGVTAFSEQGWSVTYHPDPASRGEATFRFPLPREDSTKVTFKRLEQGDLLLLSPESAHQGLPLQPRGSFRRNLGWLLPALLLLAATALWRLRSLRRAEATQQPPRHPAPAHPTPFSVVGLLERIQQDPALHLTRGQREELQHQLEALRKAHFGRGPAPTASEESLRTLAKHWSDTADRAS